MENNRKSDLLKCNYKNFDELYVVNTLIQITKSSCTEREFKGEYYGTSNRIKNLLSAERNEYITMLTLATDKLSKIMKTSADLENKITSL